MGNFFALLFEVFSEPARWGLWKKSRADDERKAKLQKSAAGLKPKEPTVR
jgi:hypothetical protein